jgi:hypothetical protein
MKAKRPAQSVIFNSSFLIGLCVFLFAVFLLAFEFATANPPAIGRAFSNASAQLNLASRAPNAVQREKLKSGFGEVHSSRRDTLRPLGGQCVILRDPIVTLSESLDIAGISTAPPHSTVWLTNSL